MNTISPMSEQSDPSTSKGPKRKAALSVAELRDVMADIDHQLEQPSPDDFAAWRLRSYRRLFQIKLALLDADSPEESLDTLSELRRELLAEISQSERTDVSLLRAMQMQYRQMWRDARSVSRKLGLFLGCLLLLLLSPVVFPLVLIERRLVRPRRLAQKQAELQQAIRDVRGRPSEFSRRAIDALSVRDDAFSVLRSLRKEKRVLLAIPSELHAPLVHSLDSRTITWIRRLHAAVRRPGCWPGLRGNIDELSSHLISTVAKCPCNPDVQDAIDRFIGNLIFAARRWIVRERVRHSDRNAYWDAHYDDLSFVVGCPGPIGTGREWSEILITWLVFDVLLREAVDQISETQGGEIDVLGGVAWLGRAGQFAASLGWYTKSYRIASLALRTITTHEALVASKFGQNGLLSSKLEYEMQLLQLNQALGKGFDRNQADRLTHVAVALLETLRAAASEASEGETIERLVATSLWCNCVVLAIAASIDETGLNFERLRASLATLQEVMPPTTDIPSPMAWQKTSKTSDMLEIAKWIAQMEQLLKSDADPAEVAALTKTVESLIPTLTAAGVQKVHSLFIVARCHMAVAERLLVVQPLAAQDHFRRAAELVQQGLPTHFFGRDQRGYLDAQVALLAAEEALSRGRINRSNELTVQAAECLQDTRAQMEEIGASRPGLAAAIEEKLRLVEIRLERQRDRLEELGVGSVWQQVANRARSRPTLVIAAPAIAVLLPLIVQLVWAYASYRSFGGVTIVQTSAWDVPVLLLGVAQLILLWLADQHARRTGLDLRLTSTSERAARLVLWLIPPLWLYSVGRVVWHLWGFAREGVRIVLVGG